MKLGPATECEFYKDEFCRITGGACPHYDVTYESCQTRRRAMIDSNMMTPVLDSKKRSPFSQMVDSLIEIGSQRKKLP